MTTKADLENRFFKNLGKFLPKNIQTLVIAVSGGADSLALCFLTQMYAKTHDINFHAITVDHCLRKDSADEALYTHALLKKHNILHRTLIWEHGKIVNGLHEKAREARYSLMTNYCQSLPNTALVTAHHAHDQIETILMRLFKGSGLKGLTGISPMNTIHNILVIRPLLEENPKILRTYLKEKAIKWIEDPSNNDTRFERTRIRKILNHIQKEGFEIENILKSQSKLKQSQYAIEEILGYWEKTFLKKSIPLKINQEAFFKTPMFIQQEYLRKKLYNIGGARYPRSYHTINSILKILESPRVNGYKVAHCLIHVTKKEIIINKEKILSNTPCKSIT